MAEMDVMALLDELRDIIEDSKSVLGNNQRRQVEIGPVLDIIEDIREAFPIEFAQARQIVRERQGLLEDTENECNRILNDAREQAQYIASQEQITRIAQIQADNIISEAHEIERATRAGAEDYADRVFKQIESTLDSLNDNVRRCRERLNNRQI